MLSAFLIGASIFWGPIIFMYWLHSIRNVQSTSAGVLSVCAIAIVVMIASVAMALSASSQG